MKRIPDCPGGMGNANDWIKAREALGFPQNRTVSYEYTTYESSGPDTVELLQQAHKEANEYAEDMYQIGLDEGYAAGYKQACIDIRKSLNTNLSSKSVKRTLNRTNNYNPVENRFCAITPVIKKVKELLQNKRQEVS